MIKKNDILKRFKVERLSLIKDADLIRLAKNGELGRDTMWSALKIWAFPSEAKFVEHLRTAIESGKELRVTFSEGEHLSENKVIVEYV